MEEDYARSLGELYEKEMEIQPYIKGCNSYSMYNDKRSEAHYIRLYNQGNIEVALVRHWKGAVQ
jgi:hypothetical protein